MFYPDKVQGNAEARRVLREGGQYLLAIWDRIERNELSRLAHETMERQFPDNPPMFMKRGPFSYYDCETIERDLRAAGFGSVEIETGRHFLSDLFGARRSGTKHGERS